MSEFPFDVKKNCLKLVI